MIVASGNGWHVLNDEPHFLSYAEIFYLQTGDRHAFEEVHDLYLTNILNRQNGGALHPERNRPYLQPTDGALCEHRYWQISEDVLSRMKPLLAALATESRKTDSASELLAESLFVQLIVALWRDRFATDGERLRPSGGVAQALCYLATTARGRSTSTRSPIASASHRATSVGCSATRRRAPLTTTWASCASPMPSTP